MIFDRLGWQEMVDALQTAQVRLRSSLRPRNEGKMRCSTCGARHWVRSLGRNITSQEGKDEFKRKESLTALYALRAVQRGRKVGQKAFSSPERLAVFNGFWAMFMRPEPKQTPIAKIIDDQSKGG